MTERRHVLIMAGGTGGHVFPALAVARELRERGLRVSWLGTRAGIEAELVPAQGFELHFVEVGGLRGKGWRVRLAAPWGIARSVGQALRLEGRLAPDAVIGLGGYASGPGGLAAWLRRIPLVIHEQNAVAGTTNRILSRLARRVLQAFPGVFPRGETTGNPVRAEITRLPPPALRGIGQHPRPRLLVLGGSLGALAINRLVPRALGQLEDGAAFQVRHQCGRDHLDITRAAYAEAGVQAEVEPFIDDMAAAYGWADFVICRAGALTVSELAAAGVGSLLIPFPAAIDDHQTRNAEWLVRGGGARLIQQRDLTAESLAEQLAQLRSRPQTLKEMAERARALAIPDAGARVADACQEVMA